MKNCSNPLFHDAISQVALYMYNFRYDVVYIIYTCVILAQYLSFSNFTFVPSRVHANKGGWALTGRFAVLRSKLYY